MIIEIDKKSCEDYIEFDTGQAEHTKGAERYKTDFPKTKQKM